MEKIIIGLTQEQINTMVHDSCVLFCKHCGCGIPRDTCTSLGTCKEHDEYRTVIRTHLMEKKKKEYPKTYKTCCDMLYANSKHDECYEACLRGYPMQTFAKLLICRDAYWKIAGEEMGLGKPWEPDYKKERYIICRYIDEIVKGYRQAGLIEHFIFEFPTEEMRDAFKKNFGPDIEICKELL